MEHAVNDIDALVREEKRLTAVESHNEAWAEGLSAGIEPEIIAEAALETAFGEMLRANGETVGPCPARPHARKGHCRSVRTGAAAPLNRNRFFDDPHRSGMMPGERRAVKFPRVRQASAASSLCIGLAACCAPWPRRRFC